MVMESNYVRKDESAGGGAMASTGGEPEVSLAIEKVDGDENDSELFPPTKTKVVLVASGMDDEMEQYAQLIAVDAVTKLGNDKTEIACDILSRFEIRYGSRWHCIVSDGQLRFYVRYAAADHVYFAAGPYTVFLFRLLSNSTPSVVNRFHRRMSDAYIHGDGAKLEDKVFKGGMDPEMQHFAVKLAKDAVKEFPDEKIMISHYITTKFELRYGGIWHSVVSDGQLGICVRHHHTDHIYFRTHKHYVFLFREENFSQAGKRLFANSQRKISASHLRTTKVIASGLDMETQQFAVSLAIQALAMNFENHENTQIAHVMVSRFEERFGMPWHCVVSDAKMGFYSKYDKINHIYMQIEPIVIFLFRHRKSDRVTDTDGVPNTEHDEKEKVNLLDEDDILDGGFREDDDDEQLDETEQLTQVTDSATANEQSSAPNVHVTACGLNDDMRSAALKLGSEAISRFPSKKMMQIAHFVMTRFGASFGPSWHCVVSDSSLGFFVRYAASSFILYSVGSAQIFLFKHDDSFDNP